MERGGGERVIYIEKESSTGMLRYICNGEIRKTKGSEDGPT